MSSVIPPSGAGAGAQALRPSGSVATTCMLLVGDRVVLRANAPPDVEYAMFEIAEIELRASEPGRVREHGYQTTVALALERLAQLGATPAFARECARAMTPAVTEAYARGAAARHVARYLGPLEMFQSDAFDCEGHAYHGVFVDVVALARDLELPGASSALQALYLASLLGQEQGDVTILLQTAAWTKQRKPGERTHKRPSLGGLKDLASALSDLARRRPSPTITESLPRADVVAFLRARAEVATDDDTRALYASLERAVAVRDPPDKGPLADPELWAVEMRLDAGDLEGIMTAVEDVERTRGRTPGTTYLRARASLALRLEPPKLIAERVSALALSMNSFQEFSLLAAEAWLEAGEARRAMPYVRDLVDAPSIDERLLMKAERLLARAVGAAPHKKHQTLPDGMRAAPLPPSRPPSSQAGSTLAPPISMPDPNEPRPYAPGKSRVPTTRGSGGEPDRPPTSPSIGASVLPSSYVEERPASAPPPSSSTGAASRSDRSCKHVAPSAPPAPPPHEDTAAPSPPSAPARASKAPKQPSDSLPARESKRPRGGALQPAAPPPRETERPAAASVIPGAPPPQLELELELTPPPKLVGATFTVELPPEATPPQVASAPPSSVRPEPRPSRRMRAVLEERGPASHADTRSEPDEPSPSASARPPPRSARPPARPTQPPMRSAPTPEDGITDPRLQSGRAPHAPALAEGPLTSGASLPPLQIEDPAPLLSKAPLLPTLGPADELAEHLSLPSGVATDIELGALPRSILEARVQFTLLARELGLDYRLKRGIELRSDVSGIEAMQAVLLETFPDRAVKTPEDAYELRRHGALLAEIIARRLDGQWFDTSPKELGRWAMIVPPDTRIWPFGRVARLVQMAHKERDLVSYFFELQARAR